MKFNIIEILRKKIKSLTVKKLILNRYNIPIVNYILYYLADSMISGPLQMASYSANICIVNVLWIMLPFSIIFTLFKRNSNKLVIAFKIIIAILSFLSIPLIILLMIFSGMVGRVDKNLYVNKNNQNLIIEYYNFDAGATDSGGGGKIILANYFFPGLRYISNIDTNSINKEEWIRLKEQ